jgi:hemerythrin superfamily protein
MDIATVVAGAKKVIGTAKDAAEATFAKASAKASGLGTATPTIFTRLEADHDEIRELLKALAATSTRAAKQRARLFGQLKLLVTAHARAEEAVLYEALKRKKPTRAEALEGYEEHHLADILFLEMSRAAPTDDRWTAKSTVLKENLEHHLGEEERELFNDARKLLSQRQAEQLGEKFAAEKARLLAKLQPKAKRRATAAGH